MLLSTTPLSKMRHVNPEQDSLVKIKLLIESMNRSPAKRSDFILIRVVHGGERSPQFETFDRIQFLHNFFKQECRSKD